MAALKLLPVNLIAFAAVISCLWMFVSSASFKTSEGWIEVTLPKDGGKSTQDYDDAEERLRLTLRFDSGRLRRWVNGLEVGSDEDLMKAIDRNRSRRWDIPVGIDALRDMSWREIVRTMGLCQKVGFRVSFAAPVEMPLR